MTISIISADQNGIIFWRGLSSDTKPAATNGHTFIETDTSKFLTANGSIWVEQLNAAYATPASAAAAATAAAPNASYRTILDVAGSHIAARAAGTYAFGQSSPLAVTGVGTLAPLKTIRIVAADYPTVNGLATKLRIRAQLYTNDTAPTGNFTFGLYPITRPATSGGAGLCIFTLGTVVVGSNGATFTAPAADLLGGAEGADFALPADGHYVIGVVTTATVAVAAHIHMSAQLQLRNA